MKQELSNLSYQDELKKLIDEFGYLFDFEVCELITEYGTASVFIHNYFVYILN